MSIIIWSIIVIFVVVLGIEVQVIVLISNFFS